MKGPWTLLIHSLKRVRTLTLAMGALLAGFQVMLVIVARSIQRTNAFEQMANLIPPFARELMGPSLASFLSFGGVVCLGYFHLAVMASLTALSIALATIPTSEIETGFIDLILSRPLARHWIITRAIAVVILCTALLLVMMLLGTWTGLATLAPSNAVWPKPRLVLSLAANLWLLILGWAGIAMAIGSASRRRGVAGAFAGFLALATFLMDYVARVWRPAESVGWLSPFRYYSPFDLLLGRALPPRNLFVLAGIALIGFTLAHIIFMRRDISH